MTAAADDPAPDRLCRAAAALGVDLDPARAAFLVRYLDAVLRENEHVNLTAIRNRDAALVLHALDSVAVALAVDVPPARALDLGTGNGFPGIAISALWPGCRTALCDRTQKKVAAIQRALAAVDAHDVSAVAVDAAQAPSLHPEWRASFQLITARAVGTPLDLAKLAQPLLCAGGCLVLWLDADGHALGAKGFEPPRVLEYALPEPAPRTRRLACYRRIKS